MRILILNWKDMKHPQAGGAEYVTHEFSKHLLQRGHQITLFTTKSDGLKKNETFEGIKIVRCGTFLTVYYHAFVFYQKHYNSFDIIIDQIHGIPFFTPLYVRKPILAYIHEVAGTIWSMEFPFFMALLGKCIEQFYFLFYRNIHFLIHSHSTKLELINKGIDHKNITIISPGTQPNQTIPHKKTPHPTLIYVGRLSPVKRIELLIEAVYLLKDRLPELEVFIVGIGKKWYEQKLKKLISKWQLKKYIHFTGYVSQKQKSSLLGSSWIHVHPSLKEGFGLTVIEASKQGTPTVSFRVPGLTDIIRTGHNGVFVPEQTADNLAAVISHLCISPKQLHTLSQKTYAWSHTLPSWKEQAKRLELLLKKTSSLHRK